MKTIGITGNIASGKSSFCQILSNIAPCLIIDADKEAHQLYLENADLVDQIKKRFGNETVIDGKVNRPVLGKIVFADRSELNALNEIVHPKLKARLLGFLTEKRDDIAFVIIEGALIFDWNLEEHLHYTLFVDAPMESRIKRLMDKGLDESEALNRINSQTNTDLLKDKADFIIKNRGKKDDLLQEAERIWEILNIL
jgi:dephospho-CoA kinase